jgi:sulfate permease, SulP family
MPVPDRSHALDHVVVVLFENRSLDNVLGHLYEPADGKVFEGVVGKGLSNPIPDWAEYGADRKVVPYTVATDMDSPNPDSGEEWYHTNTQLYGVIDTHLFDLGAHGVALVGTVPRGLPAFEVPSGQLLWDHRSTVALAAVALLLIGFSQTAGDARAFAAKHRYQIDIDQESVAQAVANAGSGLFQGMPVSTSLSASSLNDHSGARTGLASLTSGITVLLTLLVLAPLFSDLPKPVLAALIIEAVVMGMMNVPEMRRLFRVQRFDFWIAVAAIAGTLIFGVLAGVMIGIGLSLLWLISVATRPHMPLLGREAGTQVFRDLEDHPEDERDEGIVVLRMDGGLFFATSDALEDRIRQVTQTATGLAAIVLDCEGINFVDSQGSAKMTEIATLADQAGVSLRLARLKPSVRAILDRDGVIERIGADRIHGNVHRAVEAEQQARHRPAGEGPT